jgi:hypothetical protein
VDGAVNSTETSTVLPASVCGIGEESGDAMRSPAKNAIVYPLQLHLPVFINRQVLVNFSPGVISALSGTVTSSRRTALSVQEVGAVDVVSVPPGVVVVDGSGVEVGGMSVGKDKAGRVGGRVDVTKTGATGAEVSSETVTQEPRLRLVMIRNIQIFFIRKLYIEMAGGRVMII